MGQKLKHPCPKCGLERTWVSRKGEGHGWHCLGCDSFELVKAYTDPATKVKVVKPPSHIELAAIGRIDFQSTEGLEAEREEAYRRAKALAFGRGGSDMVRVNAMRVMASLLETQVKKVNAQGDDAILSELGKLPAAIRNSLLAEYTAWVRRVRAAISGESEVGDDRLEGAGVGERRA